MWAATGTSEGRTADPSITPVGHRQAQLLADFLAEGNPELAGDYFARRHNRGGFRLTHLYTSLMLRSIETARYVAERTGLPLVGWVDIHERGGLHETDEATGQESGIPGPNRAALLEAFPTLIVPPEIGEQGWWNRAPEEVEASLPRALRFWATLAERHGATDDRVAIVSHGGFFQSLLITLLGLEDSSAWKTPVAGPIWFGMSNTAVSRIELSSGGGAVRYLNRVDHLPAELITG